MPRRLLFLSIIFALFLSACGLLGSATEPQTTAVTPTATAVSSTPVPEGTPDNTAPITTTQSIKRLTVWIAPEIGERNEVADLELTQQLRTFELDHPDIELVVEHKLVSGAGGILSYLRNGRHVAPDVLPDLITLPTSLLETAVTEELVFPIDHLVAQESRDGLYPAARAMSLVDEQIVGYPFAINDLTHLIWRPETITDTMPLTWGELGQEESKTFAFPAIGNAGAKLLLQFYLAAGGTLINESGNLEIQVEPLTRALTQFKIAQDNGLIVAASNNFSTLDESLQFFQAGSSSMALISAQLYLQQPQEDFQPEVAALPGLLAPLPPLVEGWVWAITTADPVHQLLVAELAESLIHPDEMGAWSLIAETLPSHREAFASWSQSDNYLPFLQTELEGALVMPSNANIVLPAFSNALFNVTSSGMLPQLAAEEVALALQP